ncbi:MAG: PadR family transcriptional regulator [Acidimicrobiales bacterium]|nr:PadR family transcriptional regulator [Acidimicrobiales bacterium]
MDGGRLQRTNDPLASGVIDLLVLRVVADGETYGYAIAQTLETHGLTDVSEATVYTSVKRLEKNGLLKSRREVAENGRARRYYALTTRGRREISSRLATWDALAKVVTSVFAAGDGGDP